MIDTQPTINPLETPVARPSEIVRQWPDAMWCEGATKRIMADGHVAFWSIGILAEVSGFAWGEPDDVLVTGETQWRPSVGMPAAQFVGSLYGIDQDNLYGLGCTNDMEGKDAAADYLERMGL